MLTFLWIHLRKLLPLLKKNERLYKIKIKKVIIFKVINHFLEKKIEDEASFTSVVEKPKTYSTGIGKYIKPDLKNSYKRVANNKDTPEVKKKPNYHKPFSDFTKW